MKNKNFFIASLFLLSTMIDGTAQTLLTSFESSSGYALGQLTGQQTSDGLTWRAGSANLPEAKTLFVITDEKSTDGLYSLKGKLDKGNITFGPNNVQLITTETYNILDIPGNKSVSMDIYLTEDGIMPRFSVLFMPPSGSAPLTWLMMQNGYYFILGDTSPRVGEFTYDTWHTLEIVFEAQTNMVYHVLDGQLLYTGPTGQSTAEIINMSIGMSDNGGFYVDNIQYNLNPTIPVMSVNESNHDFGFEHYVQNGKVFCKAKRTIKKLSLYNLLGQKVGSLSINDKQGQMPIGMLHNGLYIMKAEFAKGVQKTFKIIKR